MKTPRIYPYVEMYEPLCIAQERQRQMRIQHALTVLLWDTKAALAMDDSLTGFDLLLARIEDLHRRLQELENK